MLWKNKVAIFSPSYKHREAAAKRLGASGDPRAVTALVWALRDRYHSVRRAAMDGLANIGGEKAVSALAARLLTDHGEPGEALSRMGAAGLRALEGIYFTSVENRDESRQYAALRAIHWSKEADATDTLIKGLECTGAAKRARLLAAELVAKRRGESYALASGDSRAIAALVKAVGDVDEEVRSVAAEYLSRMASIPPDLETTVLSLRAEAEMKTTLITLRDLCDAYMRNDKATVQRLEPEATLIGEALHRNGGITEMRRVFKLLGGMPGSRTLEMHWNGVGEWRG
jgi:HEAT repeat protein